MELKNNTEVLLFNNASEFDDYEMGMVVGYSKSNNILYRIMTTSGKLVMATRKSRPTPMSASEISEYYIVTIEDYQQYLLNMIKQNEKIINKLANLNSFYLEKVMKLNNTTKTKKLRCR